MPFTGSHPAAVLPLLRTPMPASALVAGSIAPDVPYYVPLGLASETHTARGVVTVDLVLGAVVWVLWHAVLAAPALTVAPVPLRSRLAGRVDLGLRRRVASVRSVGLAVAGLVVGAATHVLWDEFTHAGRWGPQHLTALEAIVAGLPGYRWAQYGSTVLGAAVLLGWGWRWVSRTPPHPVRASAASRVVWPGLPRGWRSSSPWAGTCGGRAAGTVLAARQVGGLPVDDRAGGRRSR